MSHVTLSRTWPARLMPFASASASATPTNASRSGSLYETAVKRGYSTKVSAIRPASSGRPSTKTLSDGANRPVALAVGLRARDREAFVAATRVEGGIGRRYRIGAGNDRVQREESV